MNSSPSLTSPQDQVLALISAGSTISEAAHSAGVHRNTVHNWIGSQAHFRLALIRARESKALFWREEAERLAAAAIDTIRALMTEASTPAGVRLKAAQSILALAMAPPPEQQSPSLLDLTAPPVRQTVHNSAQSIPDGAPAPPPPDPKTVHNSAQSIPNGPPAPPAPESPAPPTAHNPPIRRPSSKVGRNDSCPCGSGKKFKRCCLNGGGTAISAVA
jgi:SEC-C motif